MITDKIKVIAQIPIEASPSNIPQVRTYPQANNADYLLGYGAIALVGIFGYLGLWLKKYFEARLEMSIERQKEEFSNAKEDRDREQVRLKEDRERAQSQADIFLTSTLEVIKEEKENNLAALQKIANILEKVDCNQVELMHQFVESKADGQSTAIRVQNIQNSLDNIQGRTQTWEGDERRNRSQ